MTWTDDTMTMTYFGPASFYACPSDVFRDINPHYIPHPPYRCQDHLIIMSATTSSTNEATATSNDVHNVPLSVLSPVNVLMVGTGEYTTGYIGSGMTNQSDKSSGVVALTMFDLRRRHKVQHCAMVGRNGTNFPAIRQHMQTAIADVYQNIDITCQTYPADTCSYDPHAYQTAILEFAKPGDVAIIFTPDDTHFNIAMACIQAKMHVLITKPIVQTLEHHHLLAKAAKEHNVLVGIEVHKRYDPFYTDIRDRIRHYQFGTQFQYLYSYMSQPKHQLNTFSAWAGKSSDISYYLNSHHIDWSEWTLHGIARPVRVTASSSSGVAYTKGMDTEDSITLTVQWENLYNTSTGTTEEELNSTETNRPIIKKKSYGCAIYTSSWVAPKSDVHSQQRFFYMGNAGEVNIDQAHRGCTMSTDTTGHLQSINPLFMKYTPSGTNSEFVGQNSYGVQSFEYFVDACRHINAQLNVPSDYDNGTLATVHTTMQGTAILEAGRRSLDQDQRPIDIVYDSEESLVPIAITPHQFVEK
jgi:D-galacturonate reductase